MKELHEMFLLKDDRLGGNFMRQPFIACGKQMYTDGYSMLVTNITNPSLQDRSDKVGGIYPQPNNCNVTYTIIQLSDVVSKIDLIDEVEMIGNDVDCLSCDGHGEVTWEFDGHEKEDDCPVCDGSGFSSEEKERITGNKVINNDAAIQVCYIKFRAKQIIRLLEACKTLKSDAVVIWKGTDSALFKIGDCELLIMGALFNSDERVLIA